MQIGFLRMILLAVLAAVATALPSVLRAQDSTVRFAATIPPLASILGDLTAGRATVDTILPGGASPHTWEPRPSDARRAADAAALFFIDDSIDAWAARIEARHRVAVFAMLPETMRRCAIPHHHHDHDHHDGHHHHDDAARPFDAHFWTDPVAVHAIVPALAESLAVLDPAGAGTYRANAERLSAKLDALHREVAEVLAPVKGAAVVSFHPSFTYLLDRYGLKYAGALEEMPGKEPSPKYLKELLATVKRENVRAIFTEPQLPRRPAEVVAEASGLKLFELDEIGGGEGRRTYEELVRYNAKTLRAALE